MSRYVLVDERNGSAVQHILHSGMTIGSGRCDVRLDEHGVARHHALIEHFTSGFAIRDLGSRDGVLVNDERVDMRSALARGDKITIGPVNLLVDTVELPAPPSMNGHAAMPSVSEPVPAAVLERLSEVGELPLAFPAAGRQLRRSVATSLSATVICFAIVLVDAIALALYLAHN